MAKVTFETYIQSQINDRKHINYLVHADEKIRLLHLFHLYLDYAINNTEDTDRKNIILPLSFILEQFGIINAYYRLLLREFQNNAPIPQVIPSDTAHPFTKDDITKTYEALNPDIIKQVKHAAGKYVFEHGSWGNISKPQNFHKHFVGALLLIAASAFALYILFNLGYVNHIMPNLYVASYVVAGAFILFEIACLYAHQYHCKFITTESADDREWLGDYKHSWFSNDDVEKHAQPMFEYKQAALKSTLNKALNSPALDPSSASHTSESEIIKTAITKNMLVTHYQKIYNNLEDYKRGIGLLDTGDITPEPKEVEPQSADITLCPPARAFFATPFKHDPDIHVNDLSKEIEQLIKPVKPLAPSTPR